MFLVSFRHDNLFSLSYIIELLPLRAPPMVILRAQKVATFKFTSFFFFARHLVREDTEAEDSDGETACLFYQ